ncbi:MAG: methyltransferase domain-containing protein [Myxococcales bacterium]|nr:methyltransferase domain-containing protein [Myxococcales bacterium]
MDPQPHSADHLSRETRDFWWNADFLDLMARRWSLSGVTRVLDVGCGVGHWGRLLLPRCAPGATLTGVDREPLWVKEAQARADRARLPAKYVEGTAQALPFPDASFDFATCQTVLLHVPDPVAVLKELRRVVVPGGLVAVAEPVNQASSLVLGSTRFHEDVDETVALLRFELTCYRGKERLGLGHNSIGALLPRLFTQAGLEELRAWQTDKAAVIAPPYDEPEARAVVAEAKDDLARGVWPWEREETRRSFLAGGGEPGLFEAEYARGLAAARRVVEGYAQGTEFSLGAGFFFLASGRKHASPKP